MKAKPVLMSMQAGCALSVWRSLLTPAEPVSAQREGESRAWGGSVGPLGGQEEEPWR